MFDRVHAAKIASRAIICQAEKTAGRAYPLRLIRSHASGMALNDNIGRAIDLLRLDRGMSKKALAEASDIEGGNLNRLISGKQQWTPQRIEAAANGLNVRVSTVFRLAEGKSLTEEDARKAMLHELIDAMDVDALGAVFRRWPDESPQHPPHKHITKKAG